MKTLQLVNSVQFCSISSSKICRLDNIQMWSIAVLLIRFKHILIVEIASDHEEADTKLLALVHAAQISPGQSVMIRSPSGDVDILVLFLLHSVRLVDIRCLVDYGTGKNCKIIDISTTGLSVLNVKL